MRSTVSLLSLSLLGLTLLCPPSNLAAQTFTTILDNYACAQFPNGQQAVVELTPTGFLLVRSSDVRKNINTRKQIILRKLETISDLISNFQRARIAKSKLIKGTNKIVLKIFKPEEVGTLPSELQPDDAELQAINVKNQLLAKRNVLKTVVDLVNSCESGINPFTGKGKIVGAAILPFSMASSNTIYGGFVIFAPKMANKFSRQPTGYNVCLKTIYPDGSVSRLYTGFGDDYICGTGTLKFEGIPQSECRKIIPAGNVGYVIQKRSYAFVTLPGQTTQQLLDQMRLEVVQDQPIVGLMVFPPDLSRDASVKACEGF